MRISKLTATIALPSLFAAGLGARAWVDSREEQRKFEEALFQVMLEEEIEKRKAQAAHTKK